MRPNVTPFSYAAACLGLLASSCASSSSSVEQTAHAFATQPGWSQRGLHIALDSSEKPRAYAVIDGRIKDRNGQLICHPSALRNKLSDRARAALGHATSFHQDIEEGDGYRVIITTSEGPGPGVVKEVTGWAGESPTGGPQLLLLYTFISTSGDGPSFEGAKPFETPPERPYAFEAMLHYQKLCNEYLKGS